MDDREIRSIDTKVDSGRVARDGNVSILRKQVLNASVTACSSSIGCAAANGDREVARVRMGWLGGSRGERGRQRILCAERRNAGRRRCWLAGRSGSRGLTRRSRVEHTHS